MKKNAIFRFLLLMFIRSAALFSLDTETFLKNSNFVLGPEYVHIHLHTYSTAVTNQMKFNGHAWGGTATYEYRQPNGIYVNLNGNYVQGPIQGNREHRHFSDYRLEFRLGHIFVLDCAKKWKITPYFGAGFGKIVQSHIAPAVVEGPHLTAKTPTYYIPVGGIISYEISDSFQIATNVKWMPQVDATMMTSAISHGRWKLHNEDGWLVEVPLTYHKKINCAAASIALVPYWRQLTKGTGTMVTSTGDLKPIAGQIYNFCGVKLLFGLAF